MRTLKPRLIMIAVVMILTITAMITSVKATNEGIEMITKDGEYIIYINGYESSSFKFAFSKEKLTEEQANQQLIFINSCKDANGQNAAYLNSSMEVYSEEIVFIYAKTLEGTAIITGEQLNKEEALESETLEKVEDITTSIKVITKNTTETAEDINGVATTKSFGQIDIIDDENATYYYQLIKLDDNASKDAKTLKALIRTLEIPTNNSNSVSMSMTEKISTISQIDKAYDGLINTATWKKVSDKKIVQPLDTVSGDQYIALLKKVSGGETTYDAQFLTSTREDSNKFEPVIEEREVKVSLPVTYDSILLFVVLIVIVILIAIVFIRIKLLEKKEHEDK